MIRTYISSSNSTYDKASNTTTMNSKVQNCILTKSGPVMNRLRSRNDSLKNDSALGMV
ncbi:hypothetical protein CY34DRAFT_806203 [Suillus luteus UH-Slu-Lm8-n1]|uniref:Uncharacterized protein n=1 Tax=Suillus luteus UH-Slu-Lm8-n1 TaxID=930992 RepID=A0A0D0B4A7_9AGAM|nr:hypothetical protein CY34DRAFT_806203 [Suillus luteus UH-Slu-Lm8-n1]